MWYLLIFGIIFFIIGFIIEFLKPNDINNKQEINYNNFQTKKYIMTETELKFYKKLKNGLKERNINYNIFPQVDLERIIQVKNNNNSDRNRIKSRSIDFTITSEDCCKIICCIELDDYTHNKNNRIERDNFINNLFNSVNIKLIRIKVNNNYNIEEIINKIKEVN